MENEANNEKSLSEILGETQAKFVTAMNESQLPPEILELLLNNLLKELRLLILSNQNKPEEISKES